MSNEPCCSSTDGCTFGDPLTAVTEIATALYIILSARIPFLFGTIYSLVPHWLVLAVGGFWVLLLVLAAVFARLVATTLGAKARQWKRPQKKLKRYSWTFLGFSLVEFAINVVVLLKGTPMLLPLFEDPEGGYTYYWVWLVGRIQLFSCFGIVAAVVHAVLIVTLLAVRVRQRIAPGDARDYEALPMLIQDTTTDDGPLGANMADATHPPSPLRRARLDSGDGMRPIDAAAPRWIGMLRKVVMLLAGILGAFAVVAVTAGLVALGGILGGPRALAVLRESSTTQCNPLSGGPGETDSQAPCMLPFPSAIYLTPDSSTPTGQRVNFPAEAMPRTRWPHRPIKPDAWNQNDGFSTVAPLLFTLGGNGAWINSSSLVGHDRISDSVNPKVSTTLLLDVTDPSNPVPVPHWAEIDSFEPLDRPEAAAPIIVLQPAVPLQFNRTYVAAARGIAGGVGARTAGTKIFPTQTFFESMVSAGSGGANASDLDCGSFPAQTCKVMMDRYSAVVQPALHAVGWKTVGSTAAAAAAADQDAEIDAQIAWDFHTISRANSLGRFESMRDDALEVVGDGNDIVYEIDLVEDHTESKCMPPEDTTTIGRTVWGHFLSPNYMDKVGNGVHLQLTKNSAGPDQTGKAMPTQNGMVRVPFIVRIPCSLLAGGGGNVTSAADDEFGPATTLPDRSSAESTTAKMLVQYGHGLMGERSEVKSSYLGEQAHKNKWIMVATEWEGMSQYDLLQAARVFATRMEEFNTVPETTLQGWVNKQVAMKLYRGALVDDKSMKSYAGHPMLQKGSAQPISYYGNSQGSVIGGGYFASSMELERGVLGVPGSPFALLLSRSKDFAEYNILLKLQLANELDLRLTLSLVQQIWDVAESGGWLQTIGGGDANSEDRDQKKSAAGNSEKVATLPKKQVLMQAGLGDAQVTPLGAEVMARGWAAGGLDMSLLETPTRPVYGLNVTGPALAKGASGLIEYQFYKVGPAPFGDTPADGDTDTHECVRRNDASQQQMKLFMEQGTIQQFCPNKKCVNLRGCHDDCQKCADDGLWYCCSDPSCNKVRSCPSNPALHSCACPV